MVMIHKGADDFKGVLAIAPANPIEGWRYIDSDNDTMYVYYGGSWQSIHVLTPATADYLLMETGDTLLLESGDKIVLE